MTAGHDLDIDWFQSHEHLMMSGYAWIGVTPQRVGVGALKVWNGKRYGTLDVTVSDTINDDALSYDIFAGAGNAGLNYDQLPDEQVLPRDLPHVISVSATGPLGIANDPATNLDVPAYDTNYGRSVIDLAAPGSTGWWPAVISQTHGCAPSRNHRHGWARRLRCTCCR